MDCINIKHVIINILDRVFKVSKRYIQSITFLKSDKKIKFSQKMEKIKNRVSKKLI